MKVSGEVGNDLSLTSKTPVEVTKSERTVLKAGKGDVIEDGQTINVAMTMFNGRSGEVMQQIPETATSFNSAQLMELDQDLLRCAVPGEQAVMIVPFEDLAGEDFDVTQLPEGIEEGDSFMLVTQFGDIVEDTETEESTASACESLEKRDAKYPEVDLGDGSSEPTITIPKCIEPPTELEIKVLKEGDGAVVKEGDAVMTNYVGVDWNGAVRFDGNWSEEGIEFSTNGVIEGFKQAMVGQKIGSTILVTMPSDLGYKDGMTRTFVLELVSTAS